jgi:hypothetical protein
MPQLKSTEGLRDQFIADDDPRWQGLVESGKWRVADGETASVVDAYGNQTVASVATVQADAARGVANTIEDQGTVTTRAREKRLEDETSTAGALVRGGLSGLSFGFSDDAFDEETIEADKLHHGVARGIGEGVAIGASLLYGNDLGASKLLGRAFGAGEAAGVSAGARELAVASDAFTAENIGLSSSALLGGEKLTAAERSLMRAGKAVEEGGVARRALQEVPEDLTKLDAAGLKRVAAEERAALKAEADVERRSLDELRKPQRDELVSQVREMHQSLATERPIFSAVAGADVRKIEGVGDIASQLNKSYRGLRGTLDNTIKVTENPDILIGHLQMRQVALEGLQAKAPEIRAVLGNDKRAEALLHVDDALAETKQQIDALKFLSPKTPVSGQRLLQLEAGVSPRLQAIEAAQEALKNAPEMGLVGKGARAGVFAGATALANLIPGVGIAAPFVGKWASEKVGQTFANLAHAKEQVVKRSKQALDKFLDVTTRKPTATAVTATQVLAQTSFGPSAGAGGDKLPDLFKARSAEIRNQTMYDATGNVVIRPEAREAIAKRLAPIGAVNPMLADHLETIAVRKAEYVSSKLPRQPEIGGLQIGPDNWKPSDLEMRSWARTVRAAEDPNGVEDRLADGLITPEDAEAYRTIYPERFAAMQSAIFEAAPQLSKTLPMRKKLALSIFTGVPLIPALQPNVLQVLQGNYAMEPGTQGGTTAPQARPHFGSQGSLKSSDKPTRAQQREGA